MEEYRNHQKQVRMHQRRQQELEEMMQRWEAGGETLDAVPQLLAQMRYVERAIDRSG